MSAAVAPVTGGPVGRHPMTYAPADPPRAGALLIWDDHGDLPGIGAPGQVTLATPPDGAPRPVPVRRVGVAEAVALLLALDGPAHPAAAFWAAAARTALHLSARGLLLPTVTAAGHDAWRVGPLGEADATRLRELAAAMPPHARALPPPGRAPGWLPDAQRLLRDFLDAVADTLPRGDGGGDTPWAGTTGARVPRLRDWAERVAADAEAAVRLSLRLEPVTDPDGPWRAVVQVHRRAEATLLTDAAALWRGAAPGFPAAARDAALLALREAADRWPPLAGLLDRAVPDALVLDDDELADLLAGGAGRLADAGVPVHWPAGISRELTAGLRLRAPRASTPSGLFSDLGELALDWRLALRGEPLTAAELRRLAEARRPVVRLREHWVLIDPELARRARRPAAASLPPVAALRAVLTGAATVDGVDVPAHAEGALAEVRRQLTGDPPPVDVPAGLAAGLRDYQRYGLRWLAARTALGLGGCLADDMGLGKTVTLIALHLHRQANPGTAGATLVVCPASLLGNWEREITRFAPGTAVRRHHGPGRTLDAVTDGFVLTTYATLRRDVERLGRRRWPLLVADEAQHVKNPAADTARALRAIPAAARVALTGTPVENDLTDLWAILDWTTPGLLGPLAPFRARWARVDPGDPATGELARLVRPFLLRRRKSDPGIAPELPAKTETDQPVGLTAEQAALYEAVVAELLDAIAAADGLARRGLVVKLLTALKQICNHPAHYLRETTSRLAGRSGKLDLLDELLDGILPAGGSVLVFTQYVAMARLLHRHLRERGVEALLLHGGLPVARREELVRRFTDGQAPVFLLSLRAAGTGLNLTRADHVVHYDRWWNPAVEDQATDRAHRIGQTRPVQVHRLIAEGTVEDRVAALLAGKRELAAAVLDAGPGALAALDDDDLADLVRLRSLG
ncbi:DEAD/DEAH box helicase [Micromonospora sp. CPCC 205556]|uniref:DEAD/DEAH box helicase n=1 Tax=Micromonospora sp. CPCC 205556 TaxID=3122398 RepID=UPI002FF1601D